MTRDDRQLVRQLKRIGRLEPSAASRHRAVARTRSLIMDRPPDAAARPRPPLERGTLWGVPAMVVVGLIVAAWFAWSAFSKPQDDDVALAQVRDAVAGIRSVSFVETCYFVDLDLPPRRSRILIKDRYRRRTEHANGWVTIEDFETGKNVSLDPKTKQFKRLESQVVIDADGARPDREELIKPNLLVNLFALYGKLPDDPTRRLPDREIDGRRVVGLVYVTRTENARGVNTTTRTYWVDPETRLLLEFEAQLESTDPRMADTRWVRSDIRYNDELDPALFSTEPPAGYSVGSEPIYGIE